MRTFVGLFAIVATACTGTIGSGTGDDDGSNTPPATDVQVAVRDGFVGQAGVRVIFQNADGSTITEAMTDASGYADATMSAGNVTVIRTFPAPIPPATTTRPPVIYTYVGVKAGDHLQLGDEIASEVTALSAVNVQVPATTQGTVSITSACGSGQGTAPVIAMTVGNCPAQVTFYVEDGGSAFVAHAAYSNPVDLSTGSLQDSLTTSFSSTNSTPDITNVSLEARIVDGTFQLYSSGTKNVTNQSTNVDLPNVNAVDELVIAGIESNNGKQMIGSRQAYAVTPTIVDLSTAPLIPYVSNATYTPTSVDWTETGAGDADFVLATLDVTPNSPLQNEYLRVVIAPHTGMSLALPALVGADTIYNPGTQDQIAGTQGIGKATGGYDAVRARAFSVASVVQTATMSGSVTLSYDGNNPPTLTPPTP